MRAYELLFMLRSDAKRRVTKHGCRDRRRSIVDCLETILRDRKRNELDKARRLIADCGHHQRDEELGELDAAVAGRRRLADLPPRVQE